MNYGDNKLLAKLYDKNSWLVLFIVTYIAFWFWLPEQLPLYYSQALKEDRLAGKYELLIIPVFVYILFLIAEKWLYSLALKNTTIIALIRNFLVVTAAFSYFIFLKIILLVV